MPTLANTNPPQQAAVHGYRCLICQHTNTSGPFDACDECQNRMFDEYIAVKGGL